MSLREILIDTIIESEMPEIEMRKNIFYKYLMTKHDFSKVKMITDDLLAGKTDSLTDEDVSELLSKFGKEIKTLVDDTLDAIVESPSTKNEEGNLRDLYNTTLVEFEILLKEKAKKDEEFEKLRNETINLQEMNKKMFERLKHLEKAFKKLSMTEVGEFIEVLNEDIDTLYVSYMTEGISELNNTILFEKNNSIIVPKTYYKLEKTKGEV